MLIFAKADVPSLNRHHATLETQPGYRVLEHFTLNTELLDFLRQFNSHWPVILFSDGGLHALPDIAPKLEGIFQHIITADEMGYKKSQPEAYLGLAYRIGCTPQELLFVDDTAANIAAAKTAGCATHLYSSNSDLINLLKQATA